eukprot:1104314-Rhodomonas_salina.2
MVRCLAHTSGNRSALWQHASSFIFLTSSRVQLPVLKFHAVLTCSAGSVHVFETSRVSASEVGSGVPKDILEPPAILIPPNPQMSGTMATR